MPSKIILIGGAKSAGKDTFASSLAKYLGRNSTVELMSFASPMKQILSTTLGITLEELDDLKNDESTPYRGYLQRLGNEAMKPVFGDDVWEVLASKAIAKSSADFIIFSDFRFAVELIKGATTIKVSRFLESKDTHASETALKDFKFDITISNDTDLNTLDLQAKYIAEVVTR